MPDGVAALRADLARSLESGAWGEAAALVVLLDFEPIAANPRFARHVDRGGVDWEAVLAEDWTADERFLIATAAGLWAGLDGTFFAVCEAMVTAARTGCACGRAHRSPGNRAGA